MKRIFLFLILIILASCSSIKNHNAHLNDLIEVEKLKSDVDFTYQKMKDLHPKLYWYISEKDLTYKFDSLKTTITKPLTSFEFYKKLAPVVCAVREGHMILLPSVRKYTKTESKSFTKKGMGPFSQFEFELFDNKMYVVKKKSYDKSIKIGTEVIAINNKKTQDYFNEYKTLFTSDGYNATFIKNKLPRAFSRFFVQENGIKDSINFVFKNNDSIKNVTIRRKVADTTGNGKLKKRIFTDAEKVVNKAKQKALAKRKIIEGYDKETKEFRRNLRFIEKDSAIAIIKIRGFSIGKYKKFYEQSFQKIKDNKSKALVIDLRNNGGGRLSEIEELYKYLSEKEFIFTDDSQVTSKTSLFRMDYLKGPWYLLPFKLVASPVTYSILYLITEKKEDGNYYISNSKKPEKLKDNNFKGKVYVLINGGSFSASSIISSNLKGSKRATFIGEETGGAYNGTVAGFLPNEKIPNSKTQLHLGLISCIPFYKTEKEGHGIYPDQEILPTLSDRINGIDPELKWAVDDFKKIQP